MDIFNSHKYTDAPLQIEASIQFEGKSAQEVFDILGNPALIPTWFILAKSVKMNPSETNTEENFNVEFTFFGDVFEEILEWDPPKRYVYNAKGNQFPIKDYLACIEIKKTGANEGILYWKLFYSIIEGAHYKKIIPVILPPIIEESFKNLALLIEGSNVKIKNFKKPLQITTT